MSVILIKLGKKENNAEYDSNFILKICIGKKA